MTGQARSPLERLSRADQPASGVTSGSLLYTMDVWAPAAGSIVNVTFSIAVTTGNAAAFLGLNYHPNASTYVARTYWWSSSQTLSFTQNSSVCTTYCAYYVRVSDAGFGNASFTITGSTTSGSSARARMCVRAAYG